MILYPDYYLNNITNISLELIEKENIKGLILDVDNTLIDFNHKTIEGLEEWCNNLKENGVKFCVLSNSNKRKKVEKISNLLGVPYIFFAMKPFKKGFKESAKLLNLNNKEIAVVGDQIFTDVLGANRCKMKSILVKPIAEKDYLITIIKRPLEKYILKKYEEKQKNK